MTRPDSIFNLTVWSFQVVAYRRRSPSQSLRRPNQSSASPTPDEESREVDSCAEVSHLVRTWELTKRYGEFEALSCCTLMVRQGEIFGLLGPNGAGKTTLIRLMLGFLRPTSGRCQVNGVDPLIDGVSVRGSVAYLPGDARLPRHMRGAAVLRFFAEMHPAGNLERSREIADRLELDTRRHVAFMSTGMRQKLALSVVLSLATPLVILDEPTANLDPTIRAIVLELVTEARELGRTVIFSSHVLGEIEQTCDRVGFLRRGRLARHLTMSELFQRHHITALCDAAQIVVPEQWQDRVSIALERRAGNNRYRIDTAGDLAELLPWLHSLGLRQMRIEPLGLRAVYDSVHFGTDSSAMEDEA